MQINNAGVLVRGALDKATYDNTLAVNTAGPVLLSQALLPLLAPGALIINVSSGAVESLSNIVVRLSGTLLLDHSAGFVIFNLGIFSTEQCAMQAAAICLLLLPKPRTHVRAALR
jgi:NAD(P)-dependent dehydrogenase (short-subunit alcohol dehydrogenase family)